MITATGTGFTAGARIACPALVDTNYVSATSLNAPIPVGFVGPIAASQLIDVYVQNPNGERTAVQPFTVIFDYALLQSFTTVERIIGEVPGFRRGGDISDGVIENWARTVTHIVVGALLKRGFSLDSTKWAQMAQATALPSPHGVLEMIARLGAAARLAAAVGSRFASGNSEWGHAKSLREDFKRELTSLMEGGYDNLFNPGAATIDTSATLEAGDLEASDGTPEQAFTKDQVF